MLAETIDVGACGGASRESAPPPSTAPCSDAREARGALRETLLAVCALAARQLAYNVSRQELLALLERVARDLDVYHDALAQALEDAPRVDRYATLMRGYGSVASKRQRAQVAALRRAAAHGLATGDVFRHAWAVALALKVELDSLESDLRTAGLLAHDPAEP